MEKEIKYIAPWAEILSAQVEKGFAGSSIDSEDTEILPGL